MAGHGMLFADGPSACPFVALESDRDRRADEPDARHRCYAEPTPAPRALAHQREFCLSPEFGRCPIFQDWAIRAAARPVPLRPLGQPPVVEAAPPPSGPEQLPAFGALAGDEPPAAAEAKGVERIPSLPSAAPVAGDEQPAVDEPPVAAERPRAKPRWTDDWPPSASGAAGSAGGGWLSAKAPNTSEPTAAGGAVPPAPTTPIRPHRVTPPTDEAPMPPFLAGRAAQLDTARPAPSHRRQQAKPSQRDEWAAQRADLIPAWERERYTSYPTVRARLGLADSEALLGGLTRILGVIALIAVALAVILLAPGFFAGAPAASPTASPAPSTPAPTASPTLAPSPTVSFGSYTVRSGDTLSGIAVELGLLPCQIMAANPSITDPNLIQIGQRLLIPPDDFGLDEPACNPSPGP